ncbi:MAG: hypothetical protein GY751_04890 [Bacteroidetes bacterium]|nr:hypothetical protein [Bacteroidota bacterium]
MRSLHLTPPDITGDEYVTQIVQERSSGYRELGNNWMKKRTNNMWEVYVEGGAFERGHIYGLLAKEMVVRQEDHFVSQIREMVPSKYLLGFLKYFIGFFNRNIDEHVPEEYLREIYGVSLSASDDYTFIGSNYERILNYHAAHDIGHALADYMLVGCSSFGIWDDRSLDGQLLVGRNFDFYVGEEFAREKIICFMKPDEGIPFAMVGWGGMMGAVSGMNYKGLTVTINAAKSDMPRGAATPISILSREILQYASTIDEAFEIANRRKTFVSESILICSSEDGRCVIIEKSPKRIDVYEEEDNDIICTNHYQSETYSNDANNLENMGESASVPRYQRLEQLLSAYDSLSYLDAAVILRDRNGLDETKVGMGNEHVLNQLIAHHSIIFKPEELRFWVSDYPYQLGDYVAFDLDHYFNDSVKVEQDDSLLNIDKDAFYWSEDFIEYKAYRKYAALLSNSDKKNYELMIPYVDSLVNSNPDFVHAYTAAAKFYLRAHDWQRAEDILTIGLSKMGITTGEREYIKEELDNCRKKSNRSKK